MAVLDKTRKILWASSGNLCAICKCKLVVDAAEFDSASVIGDECHIRSGSENGPRYDLDFPETEIDAVNNLILLCKKDHKMIDDQTNLYSTQILLKIKSDHEDQIKNLLEKPRISETRIVRIKNNIPESLPEILSGNILANIVENCHAQLPKFCDGLDDDETELIGSFFQNLSNYADIYSELGALDQMRAAKGIDNELKELNARGFRTFAAKELQRIEGGGSAPGNWLVSHILVTRTNDSNIMSNNTYKLIPNGKNA